MLTPTSMDWWSATGKLHLTFQELYFTHRSNVGTFKAGGPVAFLLMVMFAYCAIPAMNDLFFLFFYIFFAMLSGKGGGAYL